MSRTQENNKMSLHENTMDSSPVERSQTTHSRQTHRLYPSLRKYRDEVGVADHSTGEKLHTAAGYHPNSLRRDTQSGASAAGSDIRMKAQILILERKMHELLCINEKWAIEYYAMKEKVQDLQALLQGDHSAAEKCGEGEKNVTLNEKVTEEENTWIVEELLKAEKKATELRAQNDTQTRRLHHQEEEIRRLNKALKEASQTTQPLDVWEQQAEVYKEDFLTERKDREKLKSKYLELEMKFRKVHSELHALKSQATRTPRPVPECTCTDRATSPNWEVRQINHNYIQLQRRCTLDNKS
ncbi:TNFAIP3-interacting protein 3-like [Cottoperca gobio]|uniref:TNFAIP3-interacting protein 3-like n=1 Tax=Cottoperca gobio TaxID=56716 RepID=A0A6J2RW27_COTGO|nr:TNFAIP3-interacting protein 3-like [Cottoperca gobio]